MKKRNPFTHHPKSIGENYFSHMIEASHCGSKMVLSGVVCMVHGILPFLFQSYASKQVRSLVKRFDQRQITLK